MEYDIEFLKRVVVKTVSKLDHLDMQIIKFLHQDSRVSLDAIARMLGAHPSTISYRIMKLRKAGVIRKFSISVDWRKMGKEVEAAILINCSPKNTTKVAKILSGLDEVIELHSLTGFYDILAMVTLKDMNEYKDFIEKKLGEIPEVESFRAGIVLEDFKEE